MSIICAPATRTGGAIAVVRVSGEGCLALIDKIFTAKSHQPLTQAKPYTLHYGEIKDMQDNTIDDVLMSSTPPIAIRARKALKSVATAVSISPTPSCNC